MHLTAIRYQETPNGPWRTAIGNGSLSSLAEQLEDLPPTPGGELIPVYEQGQCTWTRAVAVRLPNGRVYDITLGRYVEDEEKAHA